MKITVNKFKKEEVKATKFMHRFSYFVLFILFLIILSNFIYARSCTSHLDCPQGQICDNNTCRDCITSAECWSKKTLLKSTPAGGLSPWFVVSTIVLLIAFLGVAIFYMIAYAFQSDQFKRIAFAELMQVLASALLIAFLFGFETFETDMLTKLEGTSRTITAALVLNSSGGSVQAGALSGQIQISPFDVSLAFMRNMLDCAKQQMKTEYDKAKTYSKLMTMYLGIIIELSKKKDLSLPLPNPFAFVKSWAITAAKADYNMNELAWLSLFLYAQIAVLKFIETSLFTLFLPIGLILRSFPPTRGAGAVLVAIAIGFYFVYPLVYTLLYVGGPRQIEGCNLQIQLSPEMVEKSCPVNIGATESILTSGAEDFAQLDASTLKIQAGMNSMRFMAFVYMLISLGVTFIFIRSLSSILGADISEIGRTMFRML
ncbi:MAG: hypothetical protein QW783_04310 [Candidatus Micrarchaeia archaeon]